MMVRITLDKYLAKKGMTRYQLSKKTGIVYHTIDSYYKNQVTRYDSYLLNKMCEALDCRIEDIIEYVKTEDKKTLD